MIWEYAKRHNLTIITKDRDYSDRMLLSNPPPKVIHLRIGNLRMGDFHRFIANNWTEICLLSDTQKLVFVFRDRIEGLE